MLSWEENNLSSPTFGIDLVVCLAIDVNGIEDSESLEFGKRLQTNVTPKKIMKVILILLVTPKYQPLAPPGEEEIWEWGDLATHFISQVSICLPGLQTF